MTTNKSFLTFNLHGLLFAIDTKLVKEIIWLPELTLVEECPPCIVGVVNMRGKLVPVMDLNIRFGHVPQRYSVSDRLIILDISEMLSEGVYHMSGISNQRSRNNSLGIIVNEAISVVDIPEENIEPPPFEENELKTTHHFVSGEAKTGKEIVMILNPRTILDIEIKIDNTKALNPEITSKSAISYFCPEAGHKEKEIFHNRTINLQKTLDSEDSATLISVAVISLNSEHLCVELSSVREFSKIRNFTPVPCCPVHIAGNMNLRGNVLTMVDIRGLLNMQTGVINDSTKLIVADTGEIPVGIVVDEILDVISLREMDIVHSPFSMKAVNEKFVKGAVPYENKMIALLDLNEVMSWDGLIVNEEV